MARVVSFLVAAIVIGLFDNPANAGIVPDVVKEKVVKASDAVNAGTKEISKIISSVYENLSEEIKELLEAAKQSSQAFANSVKASLEELKEEAVALGKNGVEAIVAQEDRILELQSALESCVSAGVAPAIKEWETSISLLQEAVSGASINTTQILAGIKQLKTSIPEQLGSARAAVAACLAESQEEFAAVLKDIRETLNATV